MQVTDVCTRVYDIGRAAPFLLSGTHKSQSRLWNVRTDGRKSPRGKIYSTEFAEPSNGFLIFLEGSIPAFTIIIYRVNVKSAAFQETSR